MRVVFVARRVRTTFLFFSTDSISCAEMTCHARREYFGTRIAIFSQFYISSITQVKRIINLLPLDNFYPAISYRRVRNESGELLYMVLVTRYGPQSVASASG